MPAIQSPLPGTFYRRSSPVTPPFKADGEPLRIRQSEVTATGHAIEVRLNAEDPAGDFAAFPGTVDTLRIPGGAGVRFDSMLYPGYTVPPFYDSLLAKLIVHAETREAAITRLGRFPHPLAEGLAGNRRRPADPHPEP